MDGERHRPRGVASIAVAIVVAAIAILLLAEVEQDLLPFVRLVDAFGGWVGIARGGLISLVVASIIWIAVRAPGMAFEAVTVRKGGSHAQARQIWRLVASTVWLGVLFTLVFGLLGDVASAALSLGLVGAALAFVLQKPLLNVAAWASITYHRVFRIGDRVQIGDARGYVADIHIMHTVLREFGGWMHGETFTGRLVDVPNSLMFEAPVYNYTREAPFVWDEVDVYVTHDSDVDAAKAHVLDAAREVIGPFMASMHDTFRDKLESHDLEGFIRKEPVLRMEFGESGVHLFAIYFCQAELRRQVRGDITERVWRRFREDARVRIAVPHLRVVGEGALDL